ncbi:signal peptidase I [Subtercola boreus]|uniref:signal peptidase I n=1 Tax=Subtercola boreus TaxID=120213 RepID=UPI000E2F290E|nr:signal peptidase I [Subtercola boreus]
MPSQREQKGAHSGPYRWIPKQAPLSLPGRFLFVTAASVLGAVLLAALVFFLTGGRWFVVQTPSMGETAPVGTLILTTPTYDSNEVGDVITFHPPTTPDEVYTHRIISIDADGAISTRGDINGATDPWQLRSSDIIGHASFILPTAGWVVKAIPIVAVGSLLVWALSSMFRSPTTRSALRVAGTSLVVAVAAYILRPLIGIVVLSTTADTTGATATVVSTGILPIRVQAAGGNTADLVTGQVGTLTVPSLLDTSQYHLASALNLSLLGWVILLAVCAIPLLWTIIIGLPADPENGTA